MRVEGGNLSEKKSTKCKTRFNIKFTIKKKMLKITMKEDNEIFFFKSVDTLFACRKCTFIVSVTKKVTVIKKKI